MFHFDVPLFALHGRGSTLRYRGTFCPDRLRRQPLAVCLELRLQNLSE